MFWRKIIGCWKSVVVIGAIAYVSLFRKLDMVLPLMVGLDKWIHGIMYLVLVLVLLLDSKRVWWYQTGNGVRGFWAKKWWLVISIISIMYGGLIEILQERYFYPRVGDWMDWLADCIGVLVGMCIWFVGEKWYEGRMAK